MSRSIAIAIALAFLLGIGGIALLAQWRKENYLKAEIDEELEDALKSTFPASDPFSVGHSTGTEQLRPPGK